MTRLLNLVINFKKRRYEMQHLAAIFPGLKDMLFSFFLSFCLVPLCLWIECDLGNLGMS